MLFSTSHGALDGATSANSSSRIHSLTPLLRSPMAMPMLSTNGFEDNSLCHTVTCWSYSPAGFYGGATGITFIVNILTFRLFALAGGNIVLGSIFVFIVTLASSRPVLDRRCCLFLYDGRAAWAIGAPGKARLWKYGGKYVGKCNWLAFYCFRFSSAGILDQLALSLYLLFHFLLASHFA